MHKIHRPTIQCTYKANLECIIQSIFAQLISKGLGVNDGFSSAKLFQT